MSESHSAPSAAADIPTAPLKQPTLLRLGGGLGIAGTCIGFLIFFVACAGFDAAFSFAPVPIGLGAAGLLFAFVGATVQRKRVDQDTHVLAAIFTGVLAIIGGLFEMAVLHNWALFPK